MEDLYRTIVENMHDGLYFVDRGRRITYWNKGAERITGYAAAEVVGTSCADNILVHVDALGRQLCQGSCPLIASMADGATHEAEVFLHHKLGHRLPVWVRTSPLRGPDGEFTGAIELFTEISSRAALQAQVEELKKLALLDALTGLPNRRHLEAHLHARVRRQHAQPLGNGLQQVRVGVRENARELLPAPAADHVERTHGERQSVGHHGQHLVAHVAVVDLLEVVDVQEEQAEADAAAPQLLEPCVQVGFQMTAVGQTGQCVEQCELLELFHLCLQRRARADFGEQLDRAGEGRRWPSLWCRKTSASCVAPSAMEAISGQDPWQS